MSKKIRVIVVDDSALVRSLLAEIINRQSDMECIGTANDPLIAREMIRELNPRCDHAGRGNATHGRYPTFSAA
ncbi:Chemotaxis response regulator protein-glutamate methylesterase [Comamonas terrigena]|nr:Chemotaxis response regulator protein-glutamate methylesterase [Comamonas terrigena]